MTDDTFSIPSNMMDNSAVQTVAYVSHKGNKKTIYFTVAFLAWKWRRISFVKAKAGKDFLWHFGAVLNCGNDVWHILLKTRTQAHLTSTKEQEPFNSCVHTLSLVNNDRLQHLRGCEVGLFQPCLSQNEGFTYMRWMNLFQHDLDGAWNSSRYTKLTLK